MRNAYKCFVFLLGLLLSQAVSGKEFHIYLDADMSNLRDSGIAIENALKMQISKIAKDFPGHSFTLKTLDHRGNSRRSLSNFKKALNDPKMLFIFGAVHSPPLITNNEFINRNRALTFVPWAAGGPITRSKTEENWIFRLSVDDWAAGEFLVKKAMKEGCKKPFLFIENSPWGEPNYKRISQALEARKVKAAGSFRYSWGVRSAVALEGVSKISKSESDCLFFVGNSNDALVIFDSMKNLKKKIPIYSHWGIAGTDNRKVAGVISESGLKVRVLQTSFSFLNKKLNPFQEKKKKEIFKYMKYQSENQIQPMTAWVHTIDLTAIVFAHLKTLDLEQENQKIREKLKSSLETKKVPVKGLIHNYDQAFRVYSEKNPDAHEALSNKDFVLRKFKKDGGLID